MPGQPCGVQDCLFTTNEAWTVAQQLQQLDIHTRIHTPVAATAEPTVRPERPNKPVLFMTGRYCDEQAWEQFKHHWNVYKGLCNIRDNQANASLQDCLPQDVRITLHSHFGDLLSNQTETVLLGNVERIVVLRKSKQAIVVELEKLVQQPEETAWLFVTKLKNLARQAGFKKTVKCSCNPATVN